MRIVTMAHGALQAHLYFMSVQGEQDPASSKRAMAERNERRLQDLLRVEENKYCADCGQKGKYCTV